MPARRPDWICGGCRVNTRGGAPITGKKLPFFDFVVWGGQRKSPEHFWFSKSVLAPVCDIVRKRKKRRTTIVAVLRFFISNPWIVHPLPHPEHPSCIFAWRQISQPQAETASFSSFCLSLLGTSFALYLIGKTDVLGGLFLRVHFPQHLSVRGVNLIRGIAIQVHGWVVVRHLPVKKINHVHVYQRLLLQKYL